MQLNAYLMYIYTFLHICSHITHISILLHEDTTYIWTVVPIICIICIICIWEHSIGTRVDFLQLAILQVTHIDVDLILEVLKESGLYPDIERLTWGIVT